MRVGIAGCGAIGSLIAEKLVSGSFPGLELTALASRSYESATALAARLNCSKVELVSLEALPIHCDLVVEAASKFAMPSIARSALAAGCHVLALSSGGLADDPELPAFAQASGFGLFLPSGALCGIDAVLAAREVGLSLVELTITKKPEALFGAPHLERNGIDLTNLSGPIVVFEGSAAEAVQGFPSNANVAVTLSFAGMGLNQTRVRIVAEPGRNRTRQELHAESHAGSIFSITEGDVMPGNPRSGHLAVLSALALLRGLNSGMHLGTSGSC